MRTLLFTSLRLISMEKHEIFSPCYHFMLVVKTELLPQESQRIKIQKCFVILSRPEKIKVHNAEKSKLSCENSFSLFWALNSKTMFKFY